MELHPGLFLVLGFSRLDFLFYHRINESPLLSVAIHYFMWQRSMIYERIITDGCIDAHVVLEQHVSRVY